LHNVSVSNTGQIEQCPYLAIFTTLPTTNQFRALVIHNTTVEGVDMPVVVYERDCPTRMRVADNEEDFMGDQTNSSSLTDFSDEEMSS
jgi:hypothetical protein